MDPGNEFIAELADGEVAAVPKTFAELLESLDLKGHEVAKALAGEAANATWAEALAPVVKAHADDVDTQAHAKLVLGAHVDAVVPPYLLVVVDKEVRVVYGLRACRALDPEGRRFAGLMGERIASAGGTACPPKLVITHEGETQRQCQHQAIGRLGGRAPALLAAETLIRDDSELELLPAATTPDGEPDPPMVFTWKALPVHPKIAIFFLRGVPVTKALQLGIALVRSAPEDAGPAFNGPLSFLRVAALAGTGAASDQSALSNQWVRQDPSASGELEEWCLSLCDAYAHKYRPSGPKAAADTSRREDAAPRPEAETAPRMTGPPAEKEPNKRVYSQAELGRLHALCGSDIMVEGDYTVHGLPRFWREFESTRGKFHSARSHVESWFDHHWPADAPRHQRFVSTALLKDLVTLDFDGQDTWLTYSCRANGFSVFSVYPLPDNADPGDKRHKTKSHEDTMDNHAPADRETMNKLSGFEGRIPADRTELWKWLQYFAAAVQTVFGTDAPLLPFLIRMRELINAETMFRNFGASDWRAYFWKYHCAVRAYFAPSGSEHDRIQPLRDLLSRLRQGQPIGPQEVPKEIFGVAPTGNRPSGGTSGGGGLGGGSPTSSGSGQTRSQDRGQSEAKRLAAEWGRNLAPHLDGAKRAVEGAGKTWNLKALCPRSCNEAFGDMARLLKENRSGRQLPCPRLFTYGKCNVRSCNGCHQFTRPPSAEQARMFTDWVTARCAEIKQDPSKV